MERGAALSRFARHAKSSSGLNLMPDNQSNDDTNTNVNNANAGGNTTTNNNVVIPLPGMVREQDRYMPIANVIRLMRRILPPHAKISDDAKETVQECVSEYISFITGEANERCQREQRKTINAEDIIWAMGKLGFDEYVEPLTLFLARYRESENEKNSIPERNLKRSMDFGSLSMGPPPLPIAPLPMGPLSMGPLSMGPYGQPFQMGPQQGIFDPAGTTLMGGYYKDAGSVAAAGGYYKDGLGSAAGHLRDGSSSGAGCFKDGLGGYYRDGLNATAGYFKDGPGSASGSGSAAAGSSSQAAMTSYDPFAQFK